MLKRDLFMSTCKIIMLTRTMLTVMIISDVEILMLHVGIIILHDDIDTSHVVSLLHIDIIYLACRGQKYATKNSRTNVSFNHRKNIIVFICTKDSERKRSLCNDAKNRSEQDNMSCVYKQIKDSLLLPYRLTV